MQLGIARKIVFINILCPCMLDAGNYKYQYNGFFWLHSEVSSAARDSIKLLADNLKNAVSLFRKNLLTVRKPYSLVCSCGYAVYQLNLSNIFSRISYRKKNQDCRWEKTDFKNSKHL